MKRFIFAPIAVILIVLMCSTITMNSSMEGTWILVKGKIVTSEDTIRLPATENAVHMKIIGKTHFTTIWQDPNVENYEGFNGGTYTFENGIYTENLKFFSENASIGSIASFKVKLEKDRLYLESIAEEGKIPKYKISEEWKRAE